MKRTYDLIFVIIAFVVSSTVPSLAQPSQLAEAVNFRYNYIPVEIQNGFVLDSVSLTCSLSFSRFNTFHFKHNSSGQLIWEDDLGTLALQSSDGIHLPVTEYYQEISENSFNEKGLLSLQSVHYVDSVVKNLGSTIYSYDSNDRIVSVIMIGEDGDTIKYRTYQYNSSGNLTLFYWGYANGLGPSNVDSSIMKYDSLGRLKSRQDPLYQEGYLCEYDSEGSVQCTVVASSQDTLQVHHFEYDGSGRKLLDSWDYGTGDTISFVKAVFTYDGSGKILSIIDSSYDRGTWSGYDPYNLSYNSDQNLDSCVVGSYSTGGSYFQPDGILLYDHYGNAFLERFESGYRNFKVFPYYSKLSSMGVTNSKSAPSGFYIDQNYPNPFNPSTTISYQLPVASHVTLRVYDLLGREVATLVNERQTAGKHFMEFDASNLPSGVYFSSMTADAFRQVRKMLLVK